MCRVGGAHGGEGERGVTAACDNVESAKVVDQHTRAGRGSTGIVGRLMLISK